MPGEKKIELFYHAESPFSNWYSCQFALPHPSNAHEFVTYNCVEQRMMHMKAHTFRDKATAARIMETKSPSMQKALGRQVRGFKEATWNSKRELVVKEAVNAKFVQNPRLMNRLLSVAGTFAEASPRDRIWGIGLAASDPKALDRAQWKGQNLLGFILTEVRDQLSREGWRPGTDVPRKAGVVEAKEAPSKTKAAPAESKGGSKAPAEPKESGGVL
jgi:ribA/ribD-fused uncharacterized protein